MCEAPPGKPYAAHAAEGWLRQDRIKGNGKLDTARFQRW